jgi:hypothetical protein
MPFPNSNLPTAAQPWGREIQKRLENAEITVKKNEINNVVRDSQLQTSYNRLDNTVIDVQEALAKAQEAIDSVITVEEAVYYPGTTEIDGGNIRANTIAANSISAGTLTGFTVQTSSGNAVVLDGPSNALFFRYNGSSIGSLKGATGPGGNYGVQLASGASTYIFMQPNQIDLISSSGGDYGISLNGSTIYLRGTVSSLTANSASITNACSAGSFSTGGSISGGSISGSTVSASNFSGTFNTSIASNTTSSFTGNLFINSSGNMFRYVAPSTELAKDNISPIEIDSDAFINVNPVTFNYKRDAVMTEDETQNKVLGFILEDFEKAGFGEFLEISAEDIGGKYRGLRYDKLYMFLHKVVQDQNKTIKSLEARLAALEAKVQ